MTKPNTRPDDTALAVQAAQRLADYAIENGAAQAGVLDDLSIIERPIRRMQKQRRQYEASSRALASLVAELRARSVSSRKRARHGGQQARAIVDCNVLDLLLDATRLDPGPRPTFDQQAAIRDSLVRLSVDIDQYGDAGAHYDTTVDEIVDALTARPLTAPEVQALQGQTT